HLQHARATWGGDDHSRPSVSNTRLSMHAAGRRCQIGRLRPIKPAGGTWETTHGPRRTTVSTNTNRRLLMSDSFSLPTKPEGVIPSLVERFNSGKVEAMMALYAP